MSDNFRLARGARIASLVLPTLLMIAAVFASVSPTSAQPPTPAEEAPFDEAAAEAALIRAQELAEAGQFGEAIEELLPFDHPGYPVFPLLIARYAQRAGQYARAERLLRRLLEGEYGELTDELRAEAAARLAEVSARVATLEVQVTEENATGADTEVSIDGALHPLDAEGRVRARLDPGQHHVHVTAPGVETVRESVELSAGGRRVLRVSLRPLPSTEPPAPEASEEPAHPETHEPSSGDDDSSETAERLRAMVTPDPGVEDRARATRRRRRWLGLGIPAAVVAVGLTTIIILANQPDTIQHPVWNGEALTDRAP